MKTTLSLAVAMLVLAGSAHAQILRSEALTGAVLGGAAGAVIGHNSGDLRHNGWKGAAIGAGAGLILGEMVGNANARRSVEYADPYGQSRVYAPASTLHLGVSYGNSYGRHGYQPGLRYGGGHGYYGDSFRHHGPSRFSGWGGYSYAPVYNYYPGYGGGYPHATSGYYGYGSGATNGLLLGALAGGIIGHNSGEFRNNGWRGAAWGAGAGWLLGTIGDARRRAVVTEPPLFVQPAPVAPAPAAQAQPQQITIINNYYNTSPMSSANGLFGR